MKVFSPSSVHLYHNRDDHFAVGPPQSMGIITFPVTTKHEKIVLGVSPKGIYDGLCDRKK